MSIDSAESEPGAFLNPLAAFRRPLRVTTFTQDRKERPLLKRKVPANRWMSKRMSQAI
jgi:hypothetical protein